MHNVLRAARRTVCHFGAAPREKRKNWAALLAFPVIALALTGCFQSANDQVAPSPVNLTQIAPLNNNPVTPFVTPLSTGGFAVPTDDPILLTASAIASAAIALPTATVAVVEPPTAIPPTAQANPVLLATPTALATEGPCIHTVQPGEWMYSIARKYNINPADLLAANPTFANNPDSLAVGDVLHIPNCNKPPQSPASAPGSPSATATPPSLLPAPTGDNGSGPTPVQLSGREYTVVQGDTLGAVARKFNTTVQALKDANGLGVNDFIRVGQILKIPVPLTQ